MNQYELLDDEGKVISLRTCSASVDMRGGKTLADYEPVHKLVVVSHGLDAFPYVLLVHMRDGESSLMIPAGVEYIDRGKLAVYTPRADWGGTAQVQKINSREYMVSFEGNTRDTVYIRLI